MENRTGVVYIVSKFKVKTKAQPFRCIMIYHDNNTGFCFIKPLLYKIDLEIAMELFRIFTSYGPPKAVHINSCSNVMVSKIGEHMEALCPMFNTQFLVQDNNETAIPMLVVTKLHKWMEDTNNDQWEIGCCVVQRNINTTVAAGKNASPHDLFFKYHGTVNEVDLSDDIDLDLLS